MLRNQELRRNDGTSNSAADEVEAAMKGLKIDRSGGNGGLDDQRGTLQLLPDRPGEPDCIYFLRTGTCGYGSNCRFNHPSSAGGQVHCDKELPERAGQPHCGYYLKTGTCKYGSTCKYHHPKERQADHQLKDNNTDSLVLLNILGLPMREGAKPCPYYMRTGSCRYGYACKFHHPQPLSAATVWPMPRPFYGSGGSAIAPSSGPLSTGEHLAVSLSQATYGSSSLHVPQSYMPIYLSPLQGWDTYEVSASYLPERPDQPECRYYMNHGTCKYGSDCRYHHPREKMLQSATSSLGPLGLPLRPGKPVCSHYTRYGLCKSGPACKFDHPPDGYSYAYSMNAPRLPASYLPSVQYPSISPVMQSSDKNNDGKNNHHHLGDSADVLDNSIPPSSEPSPEDTP